MKYLLKIVNWILPDWYTPQSKQMSYVLTLGWGVLITFTLQIIYFVLFSLSGFTLGTVINVITIILCITSALILKYTKYTMLAANIAVGIIFLNSSIISICHPDRQP